MTRRITQGVVRAAPVTIEVDGTTIEACAGESIAAALLASGELALTRDRAGDPRGPFCNMGVCYDCLVVVDGDGDGDRPGLRVRACLTPVRDGMRIRTGAVSSDE